MGMNRWLRAGWRTNECRATDRKTGEACEARSFLWSTGPRSFDLQIVIRSATGLSGVNPANGQISGQIQAAVAHRQSTALPSFYVTHLMAASFRLLLE